MKQPPRVLAAIAALIASAASSQGIIRNRASPGASIASDVTVPAGGSFYFISGTSASPVDPGKPQEFGDTETQVTSVLTKMKAQLATLGLGMGDIVKMNIFVVGDPRLGGSMDRDGLTAAFRRFFGSPDQPNLPARTTVQVAALGRPGIFAEIEAIAAKAR